MISHNFSHLLAFAFVLTGALNATYGDVAANQVNSQSAAFINIPGVPVKFAQWETRVSDFESFLKESGYSWNQKPPFAQTADHPVVNVNLADAQAFCEWLTKKERAAGKIKSDQLYRLPTNEEWDVASGAANASVLKGGAAKPGNLTDDIFPWGTQWPPPAKAGNFSAKELGAPDDGYLYTAPVGSFNPSPTGLYDLAGNVWEWTMDVESKANGMATLRGGAWPYFRKESLSSAYRYAVPETLRKPSVGFRIVFEDKSVTAGLIASAEKGDKQRREQLTAQTVVTPEEIEKVRKQMAEKPEFSGASVKNAGVRTIRPGVETNEFVNSLEMRFRLLPDGVVYFGENEVREQDVAAWATATGKVRDKKLTFEQTPQHPAVNITWTEAKEFCNWLTEREHYKKSIKPEASYRLPTDAEWSQAVGLSGESGDSPASKHTSDKQLYPWGSKWPPPKNIANLDAAHLPDYEDAFPFTAPVRSFPPNGLHLYDLAGNVAEWCEDGWPDIPGEHVVRGSSWLSANQEVLLASARRHMKESAYRPVLGYRIVLINRP